VSAALIRGNAAGQPWEYRTHRAFQSGRVPWPTAGGGPNGRRWPPFDVPAKPYGRPIGTLTKRIGPPFSTWRRCGSAFAVPMPLFLDLPRTPDESKSAGSRTTFWTVYAPAVRLKHPRTIVQERRTVGFPLAPAPTEHGLCVSTPPLRCALGYSERTKRNTYGNNHTRRKPA